MRFLLNENNKMEKELSRNDLEQLIAELFKTQSICVIATSFNDIPRASTVEFFPIGMTLYILTEGGKKIANIINNPNISVAIHAPFSGWNNVRGIQITGTAEIGEKGSRVFLEGLEAYRNRRGLKVATLPDFMNVIKVIPHKIEYIDTTLGNQGFKIKHVIEY